MPFLKVLEVNSINPYFKIFSVQIPSTGPPEHMGTWGLAPPSLGRYIDPFLIRGWGQGVRLYDYMLVPTKF